MDANKRGRRQGSDGTDRPLGHHPIATELSLILVAMLVAIDPTQRIVVEDEVNTLYEGATGPDMAWLLTVMHGMDTLRVQGVLEC